MTATLRFWLVIALIALGAAAIALYERPLH
jgi:hypothetical protein